MSIGSDYHLLCGSRSLLPPECPMHKKRAQFSPMHSLEAPPRAHLEYMKRQCALSGASSTYMPFKIEIVVAFRENDLSALMLTLGLADFSPPHQSFATAARRDGSPYHCKTPRIIPQSTHICLQLFSKSRLDARSNGLALGDSPLILANVHPMDAQSSFGWTRGCPSDRHRHCPSNGRTDVHWIDARTSIRWTLGRPLDGRSDASPAKLFKEAICVVLPTDAPWRMDDAASETRKSSSYLKKSLGDRKKSSTLGNFACNTFKIRL